MRILRTLSICLAFVLSDSQHSRAHDIYSGLRSKGGMLCCGGDDCAATEYRESGQRFEFLTREGRWVEIPEGRIIFLPIPGDDSSENKGNRGHLCYRAATDFDRQGPGAINVFDGLYLYCAFIPPGSI